MDVFFKFVILLIISFTIAIPIYVIYLIILALKKYINKP